MTQPSFHKDQPPQAGQPQWGPPPPAPGYGQQHTGPQYTGGGYAPPAVGPRQPAPKPWYQRPWAWVAGGVLFLLILGGLAGGRDDEPAPVQPVAAPPPAVAAPAEVEDAVPAEPVVTEVTLPEVEGRNGAIVFDELMELGLTNLQLASADETDTVVLLPANWTAVSIEPGAGSVVQSDDTVVVTMTKER